MKNLAGKIAAVVVAIAFIYMLVTSFGGTKTFWGWDAGQSEWYWKVLMFIPFIIAGCLFYYLHTKEVLFSVGHGALLVVLIVVGFAASTGFKFTSGDIKQRISYLDNLGKVKDTTVLFKYYEDFYHFKTNPALKNYVLTYGELPGRNCYNAYILAGDEPRSTAPLADDCTFKWHTGAYEMNLKDQ